MTSDFNLPTICWGEGGGWVWSGEVLVGVLLNPAISILIDK